jgi:hypothetical protein
LDATPGFFRFNVEKGEYVPIKHVGPYHATRCFAVSPNGKYLVMGHEDIYFWSLTEKNDR